jgi:hypothetical protein
VLDTLANGTESPPTVTAVASSRLLPAMVTWVVVPARPVLGEMPVTMGAAGVT